jgi:mono/diheme cytochrome c family protein
MRSIMALLVLAAMSSAACAQDEAAVEAGEELFAEHCSPCHGEKLRASGAAFDLRQLHAGERARFDRAVMEGKGQMPPWRGVLGTAEVDNLWAYVRAHANDR